MDETKSNWNAVTKWMAEQPSIRLGKYASYWFHRTPRRMLHCMSYYKFAAKLIGKDKKVLDIGCNEGLGTFVLGKECGFAQGIDFDEEAIHIAKTNFKEPFVEFLVQDFLEKSSTHFFDAVSSFDVIEHIYPEHIDSFFTALKGQLTQNGFCVIGTPSLISQKFASEVSKKGHVNVYDGQRLYDEMSAHFKYVFLFSAHDELVHTGYLPLAHYLIAVGCAAK